MKWIKFSEQPPQSKIFRVRFHERGTHSINALDMETEGQYVVVANGDKFLKTNIEWLDGTENETIPNVSKNKYSKEDMIEAMKQAGSIMNGSHKRFKGYTAFEDYIQSLSPVVEIHNVSDVEDLIEFTRALKYMDGSKPQHEFSNIEIFKKWINTYTNSRCKPASQ